MPIKYSLKFEPGNTIRLQFENYRRITYFECELSDYQYVLNGKKYTGVSCLNMKDAENITESISVNEDIYGSKVLCVYTSIPTFDSCDREWDSYMTEYLMFDGKDINLIVIRGGYKLASLSFYTKLTAADIGIKPYFEMLGFPFSLSWMLT